jgi:hypothetical protein
LGEAVIQLVHRGGGISARDYLLVLLEFGIAFNLGDIYYQQQLVAKHVFHMNNKAPSSKWISAHMFLSLLILFVGIGLQLVQGTGSSRDLRYEKLLCTCTSLSLIIIYSLRMSHKGLFNSGKLHLRRASYIYRYLFSFLCALVPFVCQKALQTVICLFILTALPSFQRKTTNDSTY